MFGLQKCAKVDLYGFHYKSGHSIPRHFNAEKPKTSRNREKYGPGPSSVIICSCSCPWTSSSTPS